MSTQDELADMSDEQQIEMIKDTRNPLTEDDAILPQPPQDSEYSVTKSPLGRRAGYDAGESKKDEEQRAMRRASLPIEGWN